MRELTVIDFAKFGIIFFSGILAHEGSHLLLCHALKLDPKLDLLNLKVLCKQPKTDLQKRLIGLAPVVFFVIVGCFEIMYLVNLQSEFFGKVISSPVWLPVFIAQYFRFSTVLFMVGLIIGLSASDVSLRVANGGGSWEFWKNAPQSLKIALGGGVLAVITIYLKNIPSGILLHGKDALFLQVLAGVFEVCAIGVLLIAIGTAILHSKPT